MSKGLDPEMFSPSAHVSPLKCGGWPSKYVPSNECDEYFKWPWKHSKGKNLLNCMRFRPPS